MEFRLLGPLEVLAGDRPLPLAAGRQRALVARLALQENRVVTGDALVDGLWGESAPESARKMVQILVSQVRRALPEPRLHTRDGGYCLEVHDGELDVSAFERSAAAGQEALAAGDAEAARDLLASSLALWRGAALAGLVEPFAAVEAARLEEQRLVVLERRLAADLALGRHADVVAELEALTVAHPLREGLRAQQLLALYRSGRQVDALAAYRAFRERLDAELGIEPSARLRELERRILRQDPGLEPPGRRSQPRAGRAEQGQPEVAYARSGDVRVAYQVVGDGPLDIVLVNGGPCTFQPGWEHAGLAALYRRLGSIGRLILFDKRGTGLSDRVEPDRLPDLETRMDDVRAVLDAVASERAVVVGVSEGGSMSALFAAMYPERTRALVLIGTFARLTRTDDYPFGIDEEQAGRRLAAIERDDWAREVALLWLANVGPRLVADEEAVDWYTSYLRRGVSPAAYRALRRMNAEIDVRDVLPTISVPTLVLHRAAEAFRDATRFMGSRIPGAEIVELPGDDHLPWEGDRDAVLDAIERFVVRLPERSGADRVLTTLLVVRGGEQLLSSRPRLLARAQVARFRGRELEPADGALRARFDGPARAVLCAAEIVESLAALDRDVAAAVHVGEVDATGDGVVRGAAVEVAAAIGRLAGPGEVLVSGTVKDIVAGSGISLVARGEATLAGGAGGARLFSLAR